MRIAKLVSLTDEEFLRQAFRLVLGREIDAPGREWYTRKLCSGRSREAVLVDLARSNEARARFAPPALLDLPDEEFIDSAYVRMLGRNADADGMRNYLAQLRKHGDRMQIMRNIGASEEARRHDPLAWTFRQELGDLIRRETSFLGWRKWISPRRNRPAASMRGTSREDFELFSKEMLQVQRVENAAIKDQIMLIASAIDGMLAARRSNTAQIEELAKALADLKQQVGCPG